MNLSYFLCTPCITSASIVARSVKQASCHVHAPKWVITRTVALPSSRIQTNPSASRHRTNPQPLLLCSFARNGSWRVVTWLVDIPGTYPTRTTRGGARYSRDRLSHTIDRLPTPTHPLPLSTFLLLLPSSIYNHVTHFSLPLEYSHPIVFLLTLIPR